MNNIKKLFVIIFLLGSNLLKSSLTPIQCYDETMLNVKTDTLNKIAAFSENNIFFIERDGKLEQGNADWLEYIIRSLEEENFTDFCSQQPLHTLCILYDDYCFLGVMNKYHRNLESHMLTTFMELYPDEDYYKTLTVEWIANNSCGFNRPMDKQIVRKSILNVMQIQCYAWIREKHTFSNTFLDTIKDKSLIFESRHLNEKYNLFIPPKKARVQSDGTLDLSGYRTLSFFIDDFYEQTNGALFVLLEFIIERQAIKDRSWSRDGDHTFPEVKTLILQNTGVFQINKKFLKTFFPQCRSVILDKINVQSNTQIRDIVRCYFLHFSFIFLVAFMGGFFCHAFLYT